MSDPMPPDPTSASEPWLRLMTDPTPMGAARLDEIRSVIEQAPHLVTDSMADDLLTELDRQRTETDQLKAESQALRQRGQALARLLDEATEARWCGCGDEHTDRAIDRIVLRQRDDLLADVERLQAENNTLSMSLEEEQELHGEARQAHAHLRAAVLDQADAIVGRPLTRAETDLVARTLRTAAGDI